MSVPDEKGNPPLWLALAGNLEDIASTLVRRAQRLFTHGDALCPRLICARIAPAGSRRSAEQPAGQG